MILQLAQKAIQDRLTRILVIAGACAGICYNALWYFPLLIVVGGIVAVLWDTWLAQKIGKAQAQWESKRRRRARNEAGDAEETIVTQDIQLPQKPQVQRPEAVKRRAQAGSSTDRIVLEGGDGEPERANCRRSTGLETNTDPTPVTDVKTYNISIKLGASLIVGFLGKLSHCFFLRLDSRLTLPSISPCSDGHPWYCPEPGTSV